MTGLGSSDEWVLVVSTASDSHADVIEERLADINVASVRFNTEDYPTHARIEMEFGRTTGDSDFSLLIGQECYDLSRVRSVLYRRPALPVVDDAIVDARARQVAEAQCQEALRGLWRLLRGFWISDPVRIRRASNKPLQLSIAPRLGLEVPHSVITTDPAVALQFWSTHPRVVVKPLAGVAFLSPDTQRPAGVYTTVVSRTDMESAESVQLAPTLLQEYVPKQTELRITVVGDEVFAAEIDSQSDERSKDDWRRVSPRYVPHRRHELPGPVAAACRSLVLEFGLAFGAIDMVLTPEGRYVFLEINPNGQWLWIENLVGLPIGASIARMLAHPPAIPTVER